MNMAKLKKMAKGLNIKVKFSATKTEVVRAIQVAEGNFPCFRTPTDYCDREDCAWRSECLPAK